MIFTLMQRGNANVILKLDLRRKTIECYDKEICVMKFDDVAKIVKFGTYVGVGFRSGVCDSNYAAYDRGYMEIQEDCIILGEGRANMIFDSGKDVYNAFKKLSAVFGKIQRYVTKFRRVYQKVGYIYYDTDYYTRMRAVETLALRAINITELKRHLSRFRCIFNEFKTERPDYVEILKIPNI
jgi:hypothetical protein